MSQAEVAQRFHGGVSTAVISRHEHGEKKLSHEAATQYVEIYGVWSYELFTRPGVPVEHNRLYELRQRSRLFREEVQRITRIDADHLKAAEEGTEGLTHQEILDLAELYKVWSYELFRERIGGDDAWEDDQYLISRSA